MACTSQYKLHTKALLFLTSNAPAMVGGMYGPLMPLPLAPRRRVWRSTTGDSKLGTWRVLVAALLPLFLLCAERDVNHRSIRSAVTFLYEGAAALAEMNFVCCYLPARASLKVLQDRLCVCGEGIYVLHICRWSTMGITDCHSHLGMAFWWVFSGSLGGVARIASWSCCAAGSIVLRHVSLPLISGRDNNAMLPLPCQACNSQSVPQGDLIDLACASGLFENALVLNGSNHLPGRFHTVKAHVIEPPAACSKGPSSGACSDKAGDQKQTVSGLQCQCAVVRLSGPLSATQSRGLVLYAGMAKVVPHAWVRLAGRLPTALTCTACWEQLLNLLPEYATEQIVSGRGVDSPMFLHNRRVGEHAAHQLGVSSSAFESYNPAALHKHQPHKKNSPHHIIQFPLSC